MTNVFKPNPNQLVKLMKWVDYFWARHITPIIIFHFNGYEKKKLKFFWAKLYNDPWGLGTLQIDPLRFQFCSIATFGFPIGEIDPLVIFFVDFTNRM
jgi:hypothetical protein